MKALGEFLEASRAILGWPVAVAAWVSPSTVATWPDACVARISPGIVTVLAIRHTARRLWCAIQYR